MKITSVVLLLCIISLTVTGQPGAATAEVRAVITAFEAALEMKDLEGLGKLVSPDIVVFENGYRNNGWQDFRDHHLIPEFKQPAGHYTSSIVMLEVRSDMAWAYSRMDRAQATNRPQQPDVWSMYVLRRGSAGWKIVALNWSVRRANE
jgi:ketosteroid isomerase-like protein